MKPETPSLTIVGYRLRVGESYHRALALGLLPGTDFRLISRAPRGGDCRIVIRDHVLCVSAALLENLELSHD